MTLQGIDISNNNYQYLAGRDFYDIHAADFVIMKASEGKSYKDRNLDLYYNILHGSGDGRPDPEKLYGFYHYARPELGNSAVMEADNFLNKVFHHAGRAVYALDVEGDALKMPADHLDFWSLLWLSEVYRQTGVKPLLYISTSNTSRFPSCAAHDFGLWAASWGKKPTKKTISPWGIWAVWQKDDGGGRLDHDIFNGSADQFRKYTARG